MAPLTKHRSMLILLLLSGLIISLCMGTRLSLHLFMRPITLDLGVSAAAFGFSLALQNIVWGLSQPFVGAAADRFGARPVLFVTSLVYAGGLLLMVFSKGAVGLNMAGFLAGVGIAGTGFGVLIGVVARATPPGTAQPDGRRGGGGRLARHVGPRADGAGPDRRLRLAGRDDHVRGHRRVLALLALGIQDPQQPKPIRTVLQT